MVRQPNTTGSNTSEKAAIQAKPSVTQISTTSLGALGLCFARSLTTVATHVVSIGRYDGTTLHSAVQLRGGEAAVLRLAPGNYAANAAVAGTRAIITITEG